MKKLLMIAALLFAVTSLTFSQPRSGPKGGERSGYGRENGPNIPNLTESQREEIKAIRIAHAKSVKSLRNELGEKKARLRTLTTNDNPVESEITALIENMGELQTEIFKSDVLTKVKIRSLLTDEQKIIFDRNMMNRNKRGPNNGPAGRRHGPAGRGIGEK